MDVSGQHGVTKASSSGLRGASESPMEITSPKKKKKKSSLKKNSPLVRTVKTSEREHIPILKINLRDLPISRISDEDCSSPYSDSLRGTSPASDLAPVERLVKDMVTTKIKMPQEDSTCEQVKPKKYEYQFHMRSYHTTTARQGKKVYRCDVCAGIYRHAFSLKRHFIRNHLNYKYISAADIANCSINIVGPVPEQVPGDPTTSGDLFRCHLCNQYFMEKLTLKKHITNHPDIQKQFPCRECDMTFSHKQNLVRHLSVHTSGRTYTCHHCNKHFPTMANLKRHERIHQGLKPYSCEQCGGAFTQSSDLRKHIKKFHYRNYHPCDHCSRYFTALAGLKEHLQKHHNIPRGPSATPVKDDVAAESIKYICKDCKKGFATYVNLCRHRRLAHQVFQGKRCNKGNTSTDNNNNSNGTNVSSTGKTRSDSFSKSTASEPAEVPETEFYMTVAQRISDNLLNYLDGKLITYNFQRHDNGSGISQYNDLPWEKYNFPPGFDVKKQGKVEKCCTSYSLSSSISQEQLDFIEPYLTKQYAVEEHTSTSESESDDSSDSYLLSGTKEDDISSVIGREVPVTYICSVCMEVFHSGISIEEHKINNHPNVICTHVEIEGEKDVPPEMCLQFCSPIGVLYQCNVPPVTANRDTSLLCTKCGALSDSVPNLHLHILECGTEASFTRQPQRFNGSHYSRRHGQTVKRQILWSPKIKKKRKKIAEPSQELVTSSSKPDLQCTGCHLIFQHPSVLDRHMKGCVTPEKAVIATLPNDPEKVHVCSHCGKSFVHASSLRKHVKNTCVKKKRKKMIERMKPLIAEITASSHDPPNAQNIKPPAEDATVITTISEDATTKNKDSMEMDPTVDISDFMHSLLNKEVVASVLKHITEKVTKEFPGDYKVSESEENEFPFSVPDDSVSDEELPLAQLVSARKASTLTSSPCEGRIAQSGISSTLKSPDIYKDSESQPAGIDPQGPVNVPDEACATVNTIVLSNDTSFSAEAPVVLSDICLLKEETEILGNTSIQTESLYPQAATGIKESVHSRTEVTAMLNTTEQSPDPEGIVTETTEISSDIRSTLESILSMITVQESFYADSIPGKELQQALEILASTNPSILLMNEREAYLHLTTQEKFEPFTDEELMKIKQELNLDDNSSIPMATTGLRPKPLRRRMIENDEHSSAHGSEKLHNCPHCLRKFSYLANYRKHMKDVCPILRHYHTRPERKKALVEQAVPSVTLKGQRENLVLNFLRRQSRQSDVMSNASTPAPTDASLFKTFTCDVCNKIFFSYWKLLQHRISHKLQETGMGEEEMDYADTSIEENESLGEHSKSKGVTDIIQCSKDADKELVLGSNTPEHSTETQTVGDDMHSDSDQETSVPSDFGPEALARSGLLPEAFSSKCLSSNEAANPTGESGNDQVGELAPTSKVADGGCENQEIKTQPELSQIKEEAVETNIVDVSEPTSESQVISESTLGDKNEQPNQSDQSSKVLNSSDMTIQVADISDVVETERKLDLLSCEIKHESSSGPIPETLHTSEEKLVVQDKTQQDFKMPLSNSSANKGVANQEKGGKGVGNEFGRRKSSISHEKNVYSKQLRSLHASLSSAEVAMLARAQIALLTSETSSKSSRPRSSSLQAGKPKPPRKKRKTSVSDTTSDTPGTQVETKNVPESLPTPEVKIDTVTDSQECKDAATLSLSSGQPSDESADLPVNTSNPDSNSKDVISSEAPKSNSSSIDISLNNVSSGSKDGEPSPVTVTDTECSNPPNSEPISSEQNSDLKKTDSNCVVNNPSVSSSLTEPADNSVHKDKPEKPTDVQEPLNKPNQPVPEINLSASRVTQATNVSRALKYLLPKTPVGMTQYDLMLKTGLSPMALKRLNLLDDPIPSSSMKSLSSFVKPPDSLPPIILKKINFSKLPEESKQPFLVIPQKDETATDNKHTGCSFDSLKFGLKEELHAKSSAAVDRKDLPEIHAAIEKFSATPTSCSSSTQTPGITQEDSTTKTPVIVNTIPAGTTTQEGAETLLPLVVPKAPATIVTQSVTTVVTAAPVTTVTPVAVTEAVMKPTTPTPSSLSPLAPTASEIPVGPLAKQTAPAASNMQTAVVSKLAEVKSALQSEEVVTSVVTPVSIPVSKTTPATLMSKTELTPTAPVILKSKVAVTTTESKTTSQISKAPHNDNTTLSEAVEKADELGTPKSTESCRKPRVTQKTAELCKPSGSPASVTVKTQISEDIEEPPLARAIKSESLFTKDSTTVTEPSPKGKLISKKQPKVCKKKPPKKESQTKITSSPNNEGSVLKKDTKLVKKKTSTKMNLKISAKITKLKQNVTELRSSILKPSSKTRNSGSVRTLPLTIPKKKPGKKKPTGSTVSAGPAVVSEPEPVPQPVLLKSQVKKSKNQTRNVVNSSEKTEITTVPSKSASSPPLKKPKIKVEPEEISCPVCNKVFNTKLQRNCHFIAAHRERVSDVKKKKVAAIKHTPQVKEKPKKTISLAKSKTSLKGKVTPKAKVSPKEKISPKGKNSPKGKVTPKTKGSPKSTVLSKSKASTKKASPKNAAADK